MSLGFIIALISFAGTYMTPIYRSTEEIQGYYEVVDTVKPPDHMVGRGSKIYSYYLVPTKYNLTYSFDPLIERLKIKILDPDQRLVTEITLDEQEIQNALSNPEDNVILFETGKVGTHSVSISINIPDGYDTLGVMFDFTKWSTSYNTVYPLEVYSQYFIYGRSIGIIVFAVGLVLTIYGRTRKKQVDSAT